MEVKTSFRGFIPLLKSHLVDIIPKVAGEKKVSFLSVFCLQQAAAGRMIHSMTVELLDTEQLLRDN